MTDTVNLALPCIEGSQAQKHITHNDALRILDTLVQLAVLDRDLAAPPASPAEGQRWIVKSAGTGAWAGRDNAVAAWQDGGWQFSAPQTGWVAFVEDEGTLLVWNGAAWGDFFSTVTAVQNLALLGVGTAADAVNPLSARLNNALFAAKTVAEGGDGALRYKLSKEGAAETLSFLFQDNFSGRAEIGLTGDDDFHFKVSPDGASWAEAIVIDKDTGEVSFPNTSISGGREALTADRTYYVRTDGSDSNDGLSDSAGGAFLTIQKAIDAAAALDCSIYNVTIQVGAGTWTAGVVLPLMLGSGTFTLQGDTATPSNVTISPTGADAISCTVLGANWSVQGFKVQTTTGGNGVLANGGPAIQIIGKMEFGTCAAGHITCGRGSYIRVTATAYTISGSATSHYGVGTGAMMIVEGPTAVTLTGTPAFSNFFASVGGGAFLRVSGTTFSGAATGARYSVSLNGVTDTGGGGVNFFPGNSAGSSATGGQYA